MGETGRGGGEQTGGAGGGMGTDDDLAVGGDVDESA
jgi:hypothetical protein